MAELPAFVSLGNSTLRQSLKYHATENTLRHSLRHWNGRRRGEKEEGEPGMVLVVVAVVETERRG